MENTIDLAVKKEYVRRQPLFAPLTDDESEKLASLLIEKHFKAGETIVSEGDSVDSVYIIISGTADVQQMVVRDNAIHMNSVASIGAGNAIGLNETGFYSLTGKRTATVVATSDMVLLRLSITEFHGFALANSHVNEVMRRNAEMAIGNNNDI